MFDTELKSKHYYNRPHESQIFFNRQTTTLDARLYTYAMKCITMQCGAGLPTISTHCMQDTRRPHKPPSTSSNPRHHAQTDIHMLHFTNHLSILSRDTLMRNTPSGSYPITIVWETPFKTRKTHSLEALLTALSTSFSTEPLWTWLTTLDTSTTH